MRKLRTIKLLGRVLDNSFRKSAVLQTRSTFEEKELDDCHMASTFLENGHSFFIELNYPLLAECCELVDVIEFSLANVIYRVYPPFRIERKNAKAAAFEKIHVPTSNSKICNYYMQLPDNRVTSVEMGSYQNSSNNNSYTYCHGLRIDVIGKSAGLDKGLDLFLRVAGGKTLQWWVKAPNNPFDHGVRLCTKLLDNYQLPTKVQEEIQQDCTRKAVSPWMACNVFQSTLGFEKAINADIWKAIKHHLEQAVETDIALENFNSAISEYMNNQDEKSILSFSLCFEILENKHRKTRGKKDTNIKKLFNESILINKNIRHILKDLIVIDRGHVAHGKKPHKLSSGVRTMEEYIKAMAEYLSAYNDVTPSNKPA